MGRPRKEPAEQLSEIVPVRMTRAEREQIEAAAEKSGVKLSAWIRACLARAAKRAASR
jgi:predicted HicB family RNase H-like nuclease